MQKERIGLWTKDEMINEIISLREQILLMTKDFEDLKKHIEDQEKRIKNLQRSDMDVKDSISRHMKLIRKITDIIEYLKKSIDDLAGRY